MSATISYLSPPDKLRLQCNVQHNCFNIRGTLGMTICGLNEIKWPALSFGSPNCSMIKHDSSDRFSHLSVKTVRMLAALESHFIIDSTGAIYKLSIPVFSEQASILSKCKSVLFGSRLPVRWTCLKTGYIEVEEMKRMIGVELSKYTELVEGGDIDELKAKVYRARTPAEIIGSLTR